MWMCRETLLPLSLFFKPCSSLISNLNTTAGENSKLRQTGRWGCPTTGGQRGAVKEFSLEWSTPKCLKSHWETTMDTKEVPAGLQTHNLKRYPKIRGKKRAQKRNADKYSKAHLLHNTWPTHWENVCHTQRHLSAVFSCLPPTALILMADVCGEK